MPADSKIYRDHLYRVRSHPENDVEVDGFVDKRNSFLRVYLSLVPFVGCEYYVERHYETIAAGLVFPVSFLLFWAFYYTYYAPGLLENKLSEKKEFNPLVPVTLLFGVLIWFCKVTVVELSHLLFLRWMFEKKPAPRPAPRQQTGSWNSATGSWNTGSWNKAKPAAAPPPPPRAQPPVPRVSNLPPEVLHALHTLGLEEGAPWSEVHRRYRELAKKYHPDLNREITEVGRRFIKVDVAYRRLLSVKPKYFPER